MQPVRGGQGSSEGFTLAGPLQAQGVKALYARCGELRFSGRLVLVDGERRAAVDFVGGDPVEVKGEDPTASTWRVGQARFSLEQAIPDLGGTLTRALALDGQLAARGPTAKTLLRHCEDSLLSADLTIDRAVSDVQGGPQRAVLRFAHGRLESIELDGKPDLGALTRIERWTEGRFHLALRPLFGGDVPTPPPVLPPSKEFADTSFDVTGGVPLAVLRPEDAQLTPPPELYRKGVLTPTPTPIVRPKPSAAPSPPRAAPAVVDESTLETPPPDPFAGEDTKLPVPIRGEDLSGTHPALGSVVETAAIERFDEDDLAPPRRSRAPLLVGLSVVLALVGAAGGYYLLGQRGPKAASAPPGDTAPAEKSAFPAEKPAAPTESATAGGEKAAVRSAGEASAPAEKTPASSEKAPASSEKAPASAGEKAPPAEAIEAAEAPHGRHEHAAVPHRPSKTELLVARGCKLLVAGHAHTAHDTFKAAQKLAPEDPRVAEYLRMAAGKSGKGELIVEGKGTVSLCGQPLVAPKRLKLPAGPYTVDRAGAPEEIQLPKGGKVHLRP